MTNGAYWEEREQAFLNTIPEGKSQAFLALFWFKSEWLPKTIFEKTLLKMAGQKKHKGQILVKLKQCKHLDTTREIIFFQVPNCNAIMLQDTLPRAMTNTKLGMIQKYPTKYPRMEWCIGLPDFAMVQDFVLNTPWHNREEKLTIQPYHKMAWHLEAPCHKVDWLYTILKVMKKNRSINKLFGNKVLVVKNPGFDASPTHKMHLAGAVHFHTYFQMSVNHVALHGLVNHDKEVYVSCKEDKDGMEQDPVKKTVQSILMGHKVLHLFLWQCVCQNNDRSWKGYYLNGIGCDTHKGVAIDWGEYAAAKLQYHLLKRGVMDKSALAMIKASFSPQAFCDALSATIKQGKVVSTLQAEMEDNMEAIVKNMPRVDITMGMELGERAEYKNEFQAKSTLLNPSSPEALNFADDMIIKSINTATAGGLLYTNAFSASMGDTAYAPGDVDSQELDILEESNDKSIKDNLIDKNFGNIISNMEAVQRTPRTTDAAAPKRSSKEEQNNYDMVRSLQKVNQTTNTQTGLPLATAANHAKAIKGLIREWYNKNSNTMLPPDLMTLAFWAGINPAETIPSCPTTSRRGKREKAATPSAWDGAVEGSLLGRCFVLSGVWPDLEEEAGLIRKGEGEVTNQVVWGKSDLGYLGPHRHPYNSREIGRQEAHPSTREESEGNRHSHTLPPDYGGVFP
jgi:hypothetical protein